MNFRNAVLNDIRKRICDHLIIPEPKVTFQNFISGYSNLDDLKFDRDTQEVQLSPTNADGIFYAPRRANSGFNTALRSVQDRPIKNFDVTGLRPASATGVPERIENDPAPAPTTFIHIVEARKDIDPPGRTNAQPGRLDQRIEYLELAIDCVLRDDTYQPETNRKGNGLLWKNQNDLCIPISELPEINLQSPETGTYRTEYHKTINNQATGFVEDMESILNPGTQRRVVNFGASMELEAVINNVIFTQWGMLPQSSNTPTDTVRCLFVIEIRYPTIYSLG